MGEAALQALLEPAHLVVLIVIALLLGPPGGRAPRDAWAAFAVGLLANALLPGRRILSVRLGKTDFMDDPDALAAGLPGARIAGVERRGKYILTRLEISTNGEPPAGPAPTITTFSLRESFGKP